MKYLIFSDIHSNFEAFEALLRLKRAQGCDKILFLGDLVGYGPDPQRVIDLFQTLKNKHYIRGNHDKVIANLESSSLFNPAAAFSVEWSKLKLNDQARTFLKNLPKGPMIIDHFITICHGSTFDEDFYIFSQFEVSEAFRFMETNIGFFGHTHFPVIFLLRNNQIKSVSLVKNIHFKLDANTRYLINPGSIGQPRDKNPHSSYIIFDASKREIQFIRYAYDYKKTQKKIREAGLPEILASRLEVGV